LAVVDHNFSDFGEGNEKSTFIRALSHYYSDFLSTDFKKSRLPKRKFQTKDTKGRRSGIPLEKFSSFIPPLRKFVSKPYDRNAKLEVRLGQHKSQLSNVTVRAIENWISSLDLMGLEKRNNESVTEFKSSLERRGIDLEIELSNFINQIRRNVGLEISAEIITYLEPIFEKTASNLLDTLIGLEEELSDLFVNPLEEVLPSAIATLIGNKNDTQLSDTLRDAFEVGKVKNELNSFFKAFTAGDLFTELRELATVEQLDENLEFYLYISEIKYNSHVFPIFYMPIQMSLKGSIAEIKVEPINLPCHTIYPCSYPYP